MNRTPRGPRILHVTGRAFLDAWIDTVRRGDPFYNENLSRFDAYCPIRPVGEDRRWEELLSRLASSSNT